MENEIQQKTRRPAGSHRIEFTEESVAGLPVSVGHMDFWQDTKQPYLVARRMKEGGSVTFHVKYSAQQRRAHLALYNTKIGTYGTIGTVGIEAARKQAEEMWTELQAAVNSHKRVSGPLPQGKKVSNPESILDEQEPVDNPDYDSLLNVLMDALAQAKDGKGQERHGTGLHFEEQDMLKVMDRVGIGFGLGQAIKKAVEGQRLDRLKAREEWLGAIIYLAGTIVWVDKQE